MRLALPLLALCAALAPACGGDEFASESTGGGGSSGSGATGASGGTTGGTGAAGASGGTGGAPTGGGTAGVAGATSGGTGGTGGAATGGTGGTGGTATGGTGGTGATTSCVPTGGHWTIANSNAAARYPIIADGYIYWSVKTNIFRNKTDGTPQNLVESVYEAGTEVEGMAMEGGSLYHADPGAGAIRVTIPPNITPNSVAGGEAGVRSVAVDATHVYWTTSSGIRRRDRALGTSVSETVYPSNGAYAIALLGDDVVWVTLSGLVYRASKGGGSPTPLHSHTNVGAFSEVSVAVDAAAGNVYWTYASATQGGVFVVPLGGGSAQHITFQPGAEAVAFSETCIYWVVFNSGGSGIRARAKAGGSVEPFNNAGSNNRPRGLVAHTDGLYWVDFITGNVMKRFWQ